MVVVVVVMRYNMGNLILGGEWWVFTILCKIEFFFIFIFNCDIMLKFFFFFFNCDIMLKLLSD